MKISILTLFPQAIEPYIEASMLGRARAAGLLQVRLWDIRHYTLDKHRRTDDYPFGGGGGLIMTPQPIFDCMAAAALWHGDEAYRRIYLSPQGRRFSYGVARELAGEAGLILLCGHYEGVDQRVIDNLIDEELSIGDYVLTGGELAALVVVDGLSRFIPGVLGNSRGMEEESFESGVLEYPQYTRPADFRGLKVPEILLGGHHANIARWRRERAVEKTRKVRPDLLN